MKYRLYQCKKDNEGNYIIPKDIVEKWEKLIHTKYKDLTKEEKELHKINVERFIIKRYEKEFR